MCIALVAAVIYLIIDVIDESWRFFQFIGQPGNHDLDDIILSAMVSSCGFLFFTIRRWRELQREIGARQRAEAEALEHATHDAITGLPNGRYLRERLSSIGGDATPALLVIDLDHFKTINEVHGRHVGDRLLHAVAMRLQMMTVGVELVTRHDGAQFALLTAGSADLTVMSRLSLAIVRLLAEPFEVQGVHVSIGCSIGATTIPGNRCAPDLLLQQADIAVHRAKTEGRCSFRCFEFGTDAQIRERAQQEAELRQAIIADQIVPHYQPIIDLRSQRPVGYEVLARWLHPVRGPVPPNEFIPIAEDLGLIGHLAESLLRRVCHETHAWPPDRRIALNVSPSQLRDRSLPRILEQVLAEMGFPADRLEIEITESLLVTDYELASEIIGQIRTLGIGIALDDFGAGHASLRYLQRLPFDKIKLDASFVRTISACASSRKLVAAIADLSHSLGLLIVAEGVETEQEAVLLRHMGFDMAQGWLFGQPMSAEAVNQHL